MSDSRGFIPIPEIKDALKLVRDACKLNAAATIWTRDQGIVTSTRLSSFDFNRSRLSFEIGDSLDVARFRQGMILDPFVYVSSQIHAQGLFFKAAFSDILIDAGRIELHLPEAVYRAQQRKHPRALVKHRDDIRLIHPDPMNPNRVLQRKLYDLSAGGASLILFYGEERHYHVRQRLEGLELQLGDHSIKTWGIVRHLQVFPPDSATQGVQLGVEFFNLGPLDQKRISALVEEEIRRQFAEVEE